MRYVVVRRYPSGVTKILDLTNFPHPKKFAKVRRKDAESFYRGAIVAGIEKGERLEIWEEDEECATAILTFARDGAK